jgi:hypothetical protein
MRILILSSLFPPDPGDTAHYVKELAKRLSEHSVTLLHYGNLPEIVPTVKVVSISKRLPVVVRLFSYTKSLFAHSAQADVIIVNNAPGTELPALLISFLTKKPFVVCVSDLQIFLRKSVWYQSVHRSFTRRAKKLVTLPAESSVWKTVEWLPYRASIPESDVPQDAWWRKHIEQLLTPTL